MSPTHALSWDAAWHPIRIVADGRVEPFAVKNAPAAEGVGRCQARSPKRPPNIGERNVKLATIRRDGGRSAARIDGDHAVEIEGVRGLRALLAQPDWRQRAESASGPSHALDTLDYAPLVPAPDKIVCVGLNYRNHILETGRDVPDFPTLFAKFRSALIGAHDDIALSEAVHQLDWEAELAVVIGTAARNVSATEAGAAIAGFSVLNDVTARDWQSRTLQWLQGKTFEHSTPLGPWMVTADEADGLAGEITCEVNGETMQKSDISELVFGPADLVSYISTIVTLVPGDVIATGTPGGVGSARKPPRFLADGDVVTTRIEGIGECRNTVRPA
jgi:acylpyruvate hydrolase